MSPHPGVGAASNSTLWDTIAYVVGYPDFAEELVSSIRAGCAQSPMSGNLDALVARRFFAACDAVTLNIDSDPRNDLLKALLKEDWERTNAEVVQCLEFIYSHMVNKFKGGLAEFLAMRLCTELVQTWKQDG